MLQYSPIDITKKSASFDFTVKFSGVTFEFSGVTFELRNFRFAKNFGFISAKYVGIVIKRDLRFLMDAFSPQRGEIFHSTAQFFFQKVYFLPVICKFKFKGAMNIIRSLLLEVFRSRLLTAIYYLTTVQLTTFVPLKWNISFITKFVCSFIYRFRNCMKNDRKFNTHLEIKV